MCELVLSATMNGIANRNRIEVQDVYALRMTLYKEGMLSESEAESIFALNRSCRFVCDEWCDFFVEALSRYIIYQKGPEGIISDENAEWIIAATASGKYINCKLEFDWILEVVRQARYVPACLSEFVLVQVARAVLKGEGPLRQYQIKKLNTVTAQDVQTIKMALYAVGGEDKTQITLQEANILIDIYKSTYLSQNDPAWDELFSTCLKAMLMSTIGYIPKIDKLGQRREIWLSNSKASLKDFCVDIGALGLQKMAASTPSYTMCCTQMRESNHQIIDCDLKKALWLIKKIEHTYLFSDEEVEFLKFIMLQSSGINEVLKPYIKLAS